MADKRPHEHAEEERRHRERIRRKAELAQSIPPRGLADLLNATPEGRARVREEWRKRSRGERVAMVTLFAWEGACVVALGVGLFLEDAVLMIGSILAMGATMLAVTVWTIVASARESSRGRAHRT